MYMAGDINFENDERRSTGTSTASLTIKRLLSLKARLFVLAGAEKDIGENRRKIDLPAEARNVPSRPLMNVTITG